MATGFTVAQRAVPTVERPLRMLRAVLAANAATSALGGLAGLVAAGWMADTFGLPSATVVRVVAAALLLFAVDVALVARRATGRLRSATLAISLVDLAWVAGTVAVLAAADLTTAGRVIAIISGLGVLDFAVLQLWFRSRLA